jgi:diguanylate cyclase (GGDEF)-like protein
MYAALSLFLLVLISMANLYFGFATTVYLRCGSETGTLPEYAWFLWRREAFAALARVQPASPDESPAVEGDVEPAVNEAEDEPAAPLDAEADVEEEAPQGHPVTAVLAAVTSELRDMVGELTQLDRRIRETAEAPEGEGVQACAAALNEAVHRRLEHLRQSLAPLEVHSSEQPGYLARSAALEALLKSLSAELFAILAELVGLDFHAEHSEASVRPLAAAHERIYSACHVYRDLLLDALISLVRCEVGLANVDPYLRNDELTGLAGRIGLETAVEDRRASGGGGEDAVVLIDIDAMGAVNREHGAETGDRLLAAVAEFLVQVRKHGWLASRVAGQQFLLLCAGTPLHAAAECAERIRQSIENTSFRCGGRCLRVSISAAVVDLLPGDTIDGLLDRGTATAREAKSYGRNRTFLYEGDCPTPIVPPDLAVAHQEMRL